MRAIRRGPLPLVLAAMTVLWHLSEAPAASATHAPPEPIVVGFDGAYGVKNATSSPAIEMGLRIAIDEINSAGGVLDGRPFELVTMDNRMVPARGRANLKTLANDPRLLAVFGGRFSPVLLEQIPLAHRLRVLLMAVWSSADGITAHGFRPSYVFRLSLKDSWAMPAMIHHAQAMGARRVGILVPNMSWGRSNAAAAERVLSETRAVESVGPLWYNLGERNMLPFYDQLVDQGADAVILVANDFEGSALVRQLADVPTRRWLPIVSHWGVAGGEMAAASGPTLHELHFDVIQTFSFSKARPKPMARFMKTARKLYGIKSSDKLTAAVGIAHAYDLMHILAKAVQLAGSAERPRVRDALERVPYHSGLIKEYRPPFTKGRHEALDESLLFFARFREDGVLVPSHENRGAGRR